MFAGNKYFLMMKHKYLIACCLLAGMVACQDDTKDDNIYSKPLSFNKKNYEVMRDGAMNINVDNGSGKYSLTVGDTAVLHVSYTDGYYGIIGCITVQGKKKGTSPLIITDNTTRLSDTLQIKVTDPYAACYITVSNHPALANSRYLFLIDNEARDFYVFADDADELPAAPTALLIGRGTYRFSTEEGTGETPAIPYLHLTYASDSEGDFAETGTPEEHTFNMLGTDENGYAYLSFYAGFPREELPLAKDILRAAGIQLAETETGFTIEAVARLSPLISIPEGFLD